MMPLEELREFLDFKYEQYNTPGFIKDDPISIPHMFKTRNDIEISAFLAAVLSWGRREQIVKAATNLMQRLDFSPYEFLMNASGQEYETINSFVYRTFNGTDCRVFLLGLKRVYENFGTIENAFMDVLGQEDMHYRISHFKQIFFSEHPGARSQKHLPDPLNGSAAKRLNMFLRWMVRNDRQGVDFGIWTKLKPYQLVCPLDVHSSSTSRKLGLLKRRQNDWKAAMELTANLRELDACDPVKYDFALFGLGWYERF